MVATVIRTFIMYSLVVLVLRIIGKKQLSDFEPSELVVTIIMSEVAAVPIQDTSQPLLSGALVILLLLIFEVFVSFIAYKNAKVRKAVYGTPSIFFEKGKLMEKEMEKERFNITDLMEAIRNNGLKSLDQVDYVIMETNGNISVIEKEDKFISYIIIDNGKIYKNNLKKLGLDENWLFEELKKRNISSPQDVFYLSCDRDKNTVVIEKEK